MTNRVIVLPNLRIQNANALSSPFTIGIPAMTAWLGAVHALQRKLNQSRWSSIKFTAVGLVFHSMELQTYKGQRDFNASIIMTANPLNSKGERPSFVVEARCHLEVSLVVTMERFGQFDDETDLTNDIENILPTLKVASGDILSLNSPRIFTTTNEGASQKKILRSLMPGFALIERRDLMVTRMKEKGMDALDAILDSLSVKCRSGIGRSEQIEWTRERSVTGWIIPISTGYQGLTNLLNPGETDCQRDPEVPHRFAESVVTLGEFVMPYRFHQIENILWGYEYELERNLYLCKNDHNDYT